jgi:predicted dehydrogenase
MKFATIGTSKITGAFIKAAKKSGELTLDAVYSRNAENAKEFAEEQGAVSYFSNLEEIANSETFEVVYIASPNALHFEQAKLFMKNKKHIICEKPMFSNAKELEDAYRVAEENDVFLFEAIRTIHTPNYLQLKKNLSSIGKVRSAVLHAVQYSSRYDAVLNGEEPNIFSLKFSGGALVDMGVYPVFLAADLFGQPKSVVYKAVKLPSGVDGSGSLVLEYEGFVCTILCSKISHSYIPSEIHGEIGSLLLDTSSTITELELINHKSKERTSLIVDQVEENMMYEAIDFMKIIKESDQDAYQKTKDLSRMVIHITEEARMQNGIVYQSDRKNV